MPSVPSNSLIEKVQQPGVFQQLVTSLLFSIENNAAFDVVENREIGNIDIWVKSFV